ncbi:MAG: dihydrofolate reductase [Lacinutrix sp.]|uniref:dihydrofolate reductase n=1 Tax=Lacinutrix sp. TaxID=1937692 RepID=UPI0030AAB833
MFGKKKQKPQINQEQLALIENAQRRVKQKKGLYVHFVIFLIGAVFLILANTVLGIGKDLTIFGLNWFVIAISVWLFFFLYHVFNVFITNKFMGKDWEKSEIEKLVAKQQEKIEALKRTIQPEVKKEAIQTIKHHKSLTIIVAAGENNEIGKDNDLIWHLKDDLKRFKSLTSGHHIIMGRKTFESFPKPLPNRTHVVISRQKDYQVPEGVLVVNSIEDALDAANGDSQPFIIGGGEIYKQAMPFASKIELTRVHSTFEADTFFPELNLKEWKETESKVHAQDENHKYAFSFLTYERH